MLCAPIRHMIGGGGGFRVSRILEQTLNLKIIPKP